MNIQEIFNRLGLSKHTGLIYELLQNKGAMIISAICGETNLFRPAVYRALGELCTQRFVFVTTKGKRRYYHAASPKVIAKVFAQTSKEVANKVASQVVEDEIYHYKEIRFLNGFKGIREAFDDAIKNTPRGETFYRYTSEKDLEAVNRYLSKNYRELRDKKKLERMVISNPMSGTKKRPRLERFVKYIPPQASLFDQNIIQLVYGNKVSLIDLNTERVLIIENKALADFQKVIFRQLYDKLPLPGSAY